MWFLFQIKRFFLILWEESFLYIKNNFLVKKFKYPTKKNAIFQRKGVPTLNKEFQIKLENKYYDFYSLQPKLEKPFYLNSPLFIIIKKNRVEILNNLIDILNYAYDFKFKIGIELEFYILKNNSKNIVKELKLLLPNVENIEEEKGSGQFEIKTLPYTDIKLLVNDYIKILETLKNFSKENNYDLNLESSPFENDCGSALQINLSMIDSQNKNIFARIRTKDALIDAELMLNSIAGLLKNINNNLLLYINKKDCLKRFDLKRNIAIKNNNKYPAPTFISWGINNRTTCIRIPTPPIIDLESYMKEDSISRRIEFRVPSSNADIYLVLIGVITSVIEGIENNLVPHIEKTSFNVLEKNENLEKIENDFYIINDNFKINTNIIFFDKKQ